MEAPIFSGIYTNSLGDYRTALPVNFYPIAKDTGISKAYLSPAEGITSYGTGQGVDRGGINWRGICYKVQGTKLVQVLSTGAVQVLGDVGTGGACTLDYSFDQLIIQSGDRLYYYSDSNGLSQVTDADLGACYSVRWFGGYTVSTDGEFIVVTELNDTSAVNPLKYGSSEADPDRISGLERIRNELYALNRNTIEVFQNVGGNGFPFQRVEGAQLMRGTYGSRTYCIFDERLAFLGSARNESPGVYIAVPGEEKISTREVDLILAQYSEAELAACIVEPRIFGDQKLLYVHLPGQTLLFDLRASQQNGSPVWTILSSGNNGIARYRANNFVFAYGKWICGDPTSSAYGYLDAAVSSHYGAITGWEFSTAFLYNEGAGAIIHRLELIAAQGSWSLGTNPTIWTSYSVDGKQFSMEKPLLCGKAGDVNKRLVWLQQGSMRRQRMQKFRGTSDAHMAVARLDVQAEPLYV